MFFSPEHRKKHAKPDVSHVYVACLSLEHKAMSYISLSRQPAIDLMVCYVMCVIGPSDPLNRHTDTGKCIHLASCPVHRSVF